jgi:hypothetical protein
MTKEEKKAHNAQYNVTHKDVLKTNRAKRYIANKAAIKQYAAQYYEINKGTINAYSALYRATNKESIKKYTAAHYKFHKISVHTHNAQYYKTNKQSMNALSAQWRQQNPNRCAIQSSHRKFKLNRATPPWSEATEIKVLYLKRDEFRVAFDVPFEVDHIIPIDSDTVCGLHVLANLQLLDKSLNGSKHNKYQTDW